MTWPDWVRCGTAALLLPFTHRPHRSLSHRPPLPARSLQIPKDLQKYAKTIVEADGFAQVYPEHKVGSGG